MSAIGLTSVFQFAAARAIIGITKAIKVRLSDADVNLINLLLRQWWFINGLGPMLGSDLAIGVGMRIIELLDVGIVLNFLTHAELVGNSTDTQDGIFIPSAWLNDSNDAARLQDISIGHGNICLIGGLGISHKSPNSPSKVELGAHPFGNIVKAALTKFHQLAFKPLAMNCLIRCLAIGVADVPICDRSNVLSHPAKNGMVNGDLEIKMGLESGLVSAQKILKLLHCVLGLSVGLRLPNSGSFRDHLRESGIEERGALSV